MARRIRSTTTYRSMAELFGDQSLDFAATLARLFVLYEDLRIELEGWARDDIPHLQQLYFMRRSFATIFEFSEVVGHVDGAAEFAQAKASLTPKHLGRWNTAMAFLRERRKAISVGRHAFGGHFSRGAARWAVEQALSDPGEKYGLESAEYTDPPGRGFRLNIAEGVVANSVSIGRAPNTTRADHLRQLFELSSAAYESSTDCVKTVTGAWLMPRYGFEIKWS